jgi:integrase
VDYIRTIIKAALNQAVDNNLIIKNPSTASKLPPVEKKEVVPFTRSESECFLLSIKCDRMFAAYYLALFTGLRRGEILGLMWSDIDFETGKFEIKRNLVCIKDDTTGKQYLDFQPPKTPKSRRTIPMTDDIIKVLNAHTEKQDKEKFFFREKYQDENLVFCSEDGRRIWPRNFERQYTNLLKRAGIEHKKLHTTRHTFASMMIEDGEDIRTVQEILGHATLAMTSDIYSHVIEKTKKKAINRMNGLLNVPID